MGRSDSATGKLNSPGGDASGAYSNYYKAEQDAKANPGNYSIANAAVTQAAKNLGVPEWWIRPTLELVARESSFNPNAKNSSSSAKGLFQFMDATRENYGGSKVDWGDPYQQAYAGLRYIKDRYGDPVKALQHWDQNKWY